METILISTGSAVANNGIASSAGVASSFGINVEAALGSSSVASCVDSWTSTLQFPFIDFGVSSSKLSPITSTYTSCSDSSDVTVSTGQGHWYGMINEKDVKTCLKATFSIETSDNVFLGTQSEPCGTVSCLNSLVADQGIVSVTLTLLPESTIFVFGGVESDSYTSTFFFDTSEVQCTDDIESTKETTVVENSSVEQPTEVVIGAASDSDACDSALPIVSLPYETFGVYGLVSDSKNMMRDSKTCIGPKTGFWWQLDSSVYDVDSSTGKQCVMASFIGEEQAECIVSVYNGTQCNDITCVNSATGQGSASAPFVTEPGQSYYIAGSASRLDSSDNSYTLKVTATPCPASTDCATTNVIQELPYNETVRYTFTTPEAESSSAFSCDELDPLQRTLWYRIRSKNGDDIRITLSKPTFVAVYTYSGCEKLSCILQGQYTDSIRFSTAPMQMYAIVLASSDDDYDTEFDISIESLDAFKDCETARPIHAFPFYDFGSSEMRLSNSSEPAMTCSSIETEATLSSWWIYESGMIGKCLRASYQEEDTDNEKVIALLQGENCGEMSCIGDARSGIGVNLEWTAVPMETYHLMAGVIGDSVGGDYIMNIEEADCLGRQACVNGTVIDLVPFEVIGKHTGTPGGYGILAYTCEDLNNDYVANWYSLEGINATLLLSVQAAYPIDLAVYSGNPGDCSTSTCTEYIVSDNTIEWEASSLKDYWILVSAPQQDADITYTLSITSEDYIANAVCENAIVIAEYPAFFRDRYAEIPSSVEDLATVCPDLDPDTKGVWFSIEGSPDLGKCMSATFTKSSTDPLILALYSGSDCSNMTCYDQSEGMGTVLITWETSQSVGDNYYILAGSISNETSGVIGIEVVEINCTASNTCENAMNLTDIPINITASSEYASAEKTNASFVCDEIDPKYVTSWYNIDGVNGLVTLDIETEYALFVAVYTNTCDELECLLQEKEAKSLTWQSELGVQYKILIGADSERAKASYTLYVSVTATTPNYACSLASSVTMLPVNETIDTPAVLKPQSDESFYTCSLVTNETVGVWYVINTRRGDPTRCFGAKFSKDSSDKRVLALYEGSDCSDLQCAQEQEAGDSVGLSFQANGGSRYYIFGGTTGFDTSGSASFQLVDFDCWGNDQCGLAVDITSAMPLISTTSHDFAGVDANTGSPTFSCDFFNERTRSLWYRIVGRGTTITVSVQVEYYLVIGVYTGSGCSSLECVDQVQGTTAITWLAQQGVTYWLAIGAESLDAQGTLELVIA